MEDASFWRDCPAVQVDPEKLAGEPTVGAYRVAARTVIEAEELGQSAAETADDFGIPLQDVLTIRAYHARHAKAPIAS